MNINIWLLLGIVLYFCTCTDAKNSKMITTVDDFGHNENPVSGVHRARHHRTEESFTKKSGLTNEGTPDDVPLICISKDHVDGEVTQVVCDPRREPWTKPNAKLEAHCTSTFEGSRLLKAGCWLHMEDDLITEMCGHTKCVAEWEERGPNTCCCQAALCNQDFELQRKLVSE